MKQKIVTLTIKDKTWVFKLLNSSSYLKKHGDDSDAITMPTEKEVHFDKASLTIGVILHELMHVYVDESNTESARLTPDQVEELACTIVQEHYIDIIKYAHTIMDKFTKQEE